MSSRIAYISEDDLFLGNKIAETHGYIHDKKNNINSNINNNQPSNIKFKAIDLQTNLLAAQLTANHIPLIYELSDNQTQITARQSSDSSLQPSEKLVFIAKIDKNGFYDFLLLNPIDRPTDINLLDNIQPVHNKNNNNIKNTTYSQIKTKKNEIYELSFSTRPLEKIAAHLPPLSLEVWWAGLLLTVLHLSPDAWKGYNFTVSSNNPDATFDFNNSTLEFRLAAHPNSDLTADKNISDYIQDLKLTPATQKNLDLHFAFYDSLENTTEGEFPVVINIDHALYTPSPTTDVNLLSSLTIVLDEISPYKKIILPSESTTILNLDKIFNELNIAEEHRKVDVRQLEQDGQRASVYEVNISDTNDANMAPITVADIQLKFSGGDNGLDVFYKNISIDF